MRFPGETGRSAKEESEKELLRDDQTEEKTGG